MDVSASCASLDFNRSGRCATASQMGLTRTLWLLGACAALALLAGWRGARPPNPLRGPRLTPWRFLMMLAACAVLVLLVHLVNLLGVHTGR